MKKDYYKEYTTWQNGLAIAIVIITMICLFMWGCTYPKRLANATPATSEDSALFAKKCSSMFPIKETFIKGETVIDTIINSDTLYSPVFIDSGNEYLKDTFKIFKTVKIEIKRIDTLKIPDTIGFYILHNSINSLQREKGILAAEYLKQKETATKRMFWIIGLCLVVSAYTGLKIWQTKLI